MFKNYIKIHFQKRDSLALTGALLAVGILYSGALRNKLVGDSWVFVYPHTFFETCAYFFTSIIPPEWESLWLRPIPMFSFWFENKLFPGTSWFPHLTNVVFHLINVYLIWHVIRFATSARNGKKTFAYTGLPSLAACIFYGLHPLTVGSVAWVAARFDVMSITFGLTGLLLWLKRDAGVPARSGLWGIAGMLLLSLLSKEQGVVFIMVCFVASLIRYFSGKEKRGEHIKTLIVLGVLTGFYTVFRLLIFSGLGGYLTARHGFNFLIPFYYLAAMILPFSNSPPTHTISAVFFVSAMLLGLIVSTMWNTSKNEKVKINKIFLFMAASIFLFGVVTTAPHTGLLLEQVIGHAESRFALIPITGMSLLAGIVVHLFAENRTVHRIVLMFLLLLGISYAWRTDAQLQAWREAGLTANSILQQTLKIAPNPSEGSTLVFLDIPRNNDQYAYIFGIGLKEALQYLYGEREDLDVIRYPKRGDLGRAKPERDFVFQYHKSTGILEKLTGVRKKKDTEEQ